MTNRFTFCSILFVFGVVFSWATATAQSNTSPYLIRIKVNGLKANDNCYLAHYYYNIKESVFKQDSAKIATDGWLTFKGEKPLVQGMYILLSPKGYFDIVMSDDQTFEMETDTTNYVDYMKISGSIDNEKLYEFRKFISEKNKQAEKLSPNVAKGEKQPEPSPELKKKFQAIGEEVNSFREKITKSAPNTFFETIMRLTDDGPDIPDSIIPVLPNGRKDSIWQFHYYKNHFFDGIDLSNERIVRTTNPYLQHKIDTYMQNLTEQQADSLIKSAEKIISLAKDNLSMKKQMIVGLAGQYEMPKIISVDVDTDAVFIHLAEKYYTKEAKMDWDTSTIRKVREKINIVRPLRVGAKLPNMVLTDTLGKIRSLYDIQTKYTLAFLYAPTCGHCQEAAPKLLKAYENSKHRKDLTVYLVNTERDEKAWRKFIKEYKTKPFVNVWDSYTITDFRTKFDVFATPTIFLLDKDKKILSKKIDEEHLEDILDFLDRREKTIATKVHK